MNMTRRLVMARVVYNRGKKRRVLRVENIVREAVTEHRENSENIRVIRRMSHCGE